MGGCCRSGGVAVAGWVGSAAAADLEKPVSVSPLWWRPGRRGAGEKREEAVAVVGEAMGGKVQSSRATPLFGGCGGGGAGVASGVGE